MWHGGASKRANGARRLRLLIVENDARGDPNRASVRPHPQTTCYSPLPSARHRSTMNFHISRFSMLKEWPLALPLILMPYIIHYGRLVQLSSLQISLSCELWHLWYMGWGFQTTMVFLNYWINKGMFPTCHLINLSLVV